jgi:adenylosuccinate lyase
VALGHSYLSLQNILKGLKRTTINSVQISSELNNHWEVLAEGVQTILRKAGKPDAYEQLKKITRGQKFDQEAFTAFLTSLKIPDDDKQSLLNLTPDNYIGLAPKLVEMI